MFQTWQCVKALQDWTLKDVPWTLEPSFQLESSATGTHMESSKRGDQPGDQKSGNGVVNLAADPGLRGGSSPGAPVGGQGSYHFNWSPADRP